MFETGTIFELDGRTYRVIGRNNDNDPRVTAQRINKNGEAAGTVKRGMSRVHQAPVWFLLSKLQRDAKVKTI